MKKFISLSLVMVLLCSVSIYAESEIEYAEKLSVINVFKGTDSGYELERAPNRLEGIIMLIRLLGKEQDALMYSGESAFTDVPDWGKAYANYAYANGLTNGIGGGLFGSNQIMDAKSYLTFELRALGYDDREGDFSWGNAVEDAHSYGVIDDSLRNELNSKEFTRGNVATCSYMALESEVKGKNKSLIEKLVDEGAITADSASKIGFAIGVNEEAKVIEAPTEAPTVNNVPAVGGSGDNKGVVITDLKKDKEYVVIENTSNVDVNIGGWVMVSEKGNQTFTFPDGYIIHAGETCKLTSGALKGTGDFTMAETTIWNNSNSDPAVLLDAYGHEVDRYDD